MKHPALATLAFLALSSLAAAQEWSPLDARTRSLGGAGVAFADGRADSLYWNPASLAAGSEKVLDFSTGFSFSMSFYGEAHIAGNSVSDVYHILDEYKKFDFQSAQSNFNSTTPTFTASDVQHALQIVSDLSALGSPGHGVTADLGTGFDLRVGPFGLFVHGLGYSGVQAVTDFSGLSLTTDSAAFFNQMNTSFPAPVGGLSAAGTALSARLQAAGLSATDANNLAYQAQQSLGNAGISDLAFQNALVTLVEGTLAGDPTTLYNNNSGVVIRGLLQMEAGVSFAVPVLPTLLNVGISLKDVISYTTWERATFAMKDSASGLSKTIRDDLTKNNDKQFSNFNMDLGAQAIPFEWLSLGLAARNLIPMTLNYSGLGETIHEKPQARFGAQATALGFLRLGADVDLLEEDSAVLPGYKIRNVGVGAEFDLPVLKLRLGYQDNVAQSGDHGRLAAGLGLDLGGFIVDLGAQTSLVKTTYKPASVDGSSSAKTVPFDRVSVGLTMGINLPF